MRTTNHQPLLDEPLLSSTEVMKMLGYTDRAAFWRMCRASGLPFVRCSPRRFMFERAALEEWMKRKTVGAGR